MKIDINENVYVEIKTIGKKNKTTPSKTDINLCLNVCNKGLTESGPTYSTRIRIAIGDYCKGEIIGKGEINKAAKLNLQDCIQRVKWSIKEIPLENTRTTQQILKWLKTSCRLAISRKLPVKQREIELKKMSKYTYDSVMKELLEGNTNICKQRKVKYPLTSALLTEFYGGVNPRIDEVSKEDMGKFKKFVQSKKLKHNTVMSYLSMVTAVFNYGVEKDYIAKKPLPKGFVEKSQRGTTVALSNKDVKAWISLNDESLSRSLLTAKHAGLLMLFTGMGYGEIQNLKEENIKYDENQDFAYIQKNRNKTKVSFTVEFADAAVHSLKVLRTQSPAQDTLLNLPSIEYMLRELKKIARLAAVTKNVTTYTFRHSYAVNWMDNEGSLEDLQKRLGHTDISTTQIYGQISMQRMARTSKEYFNKSIIHQVYPTGTLIAV